VFPFSGGFVELFAGAFGFGGYAALEGELFPFREFFGGWWWLWTSHVVLCSKCDGFFDDFCSLRVEVCFDARDR